LKRTSDYVFHPPSGSSYPGKEEANPYVFYPPHDLKRLLQTETDEIKRNKIKSALRQWGRIYVYPGYPYRIANVLRNIARRILSEVVGPSINIPYYQETDVPEGLEGIYENRLYAPQDNYNDVRFDYNRQGERPRRDIDTGYGDFSSPSDGVYQYSLLPSVYPSRGGIDQEDVVCPFPPTGGNLSGI